MSLGRPGAAAPRPAPAALLLAGLALALPALALPACAGRPAEPALERAPTPRVVVETPGGGRHPVAVELARTDQEHERGLMFRRELAEEAGMLFVFAEAAPRTFWMKNTLLPLDLLFIDEAGVVVGLVQEAEPLTLTPRGPGPAVAVRYVLEVRGGWAARHGVALGARVRLEGVPRW